MQLFSKKGVLASSIALIGSGLFAQVDVDINLNMKHSIDGESRFGRERRMTIHSSLTETDWTGEEDKLDYLINDLDVYFGRETGSATWKMHYVEEDPNKPGWANEEQMAVHGAGLNNWYESLDFADRHQYEKKSEMIMGVNDHTPMYPSLSWFPGFGKGAGGWFVKDTDAAADWVAKYMVNYFAQSEGDAGEALPKYWEAYNEPDMNFLNPSFGMIVSSIEKNWEYHKLVAQEVRARLGAKAPKIGGMCWGQLDLFKPDGIPSRVPGDYWNPWSSPEAIEWYENMLSGVGSGIDNPGVGNPVWPRAWDNRTKDWWQWDYMYQGFIDYAGTDMDFYAVHMYDWPQADSNLDKANTRSGGHIEAMLDMFEWYDMEMFGQKKEIVMSEFGTVNSLLINTILDGRRDWLYIKPFNQMMMQFLERPSHVTYSMPFAPVKATWGAHFSGNNVIRYDGATLMEPKGSWTGDPNTWTMNEPTGGWEWSGIIHFFELWKDVEGTRIDTKANDNDVQVDAYVNDNHVYVILNNTIDDNKTINLNSFGFNGNTISNVELRHIYRGDDDFTKYTVANLTEAPAQVALKPNSTIVLDYTFDSNVVIDEESNETKYPSLPLAGNATNDRGTQLCHTPSQASITATVNGVSKPTNGEAVIRIGGFFTNPNDAYPNPGMKVRKLTVNGNPVIVDTDNFVTNTRGYGVGNYKGGWFGVLELECPIEYLNNGTNEVFFERWQGVEFTTLMIQVFDMTTAPGRTTGGSAIAGLSFNSLSEDVMEGQTLGLVPVYAPTDASNKGLTWTSSNPSAITVDENGVVTAVAATGSSTITATSTANASIKATITINAIPFVTSPVSGIAFEDGGSITVEHYTNTNLNTILTPSPEVAPEIEWTTSDDSVVEIVSDGTIIGKVIGGTATVTATVKGTSIKADILVTVGIAGVETVFCDALPNNFDAVTDIDFTINANLDGQRNVYVELVEGANVLASQSTDINKQGLVNIPVSFTLASEPTPGNGYKLNVEVKDGSTPIADCSIDVVINQPDPVESVSVSPSSVYATTSEDIQLEAIVLPANASNKAVNWSTSNSNIATVDTNGLVSAVTTGQVTITATTVDGGYQAHSVITFVNPSNSLIIEAEDYNSDGGTLDDSTWGGPGYGFRINGEWIDYGNSGDWAEYSVTIPETGYYQVTYHYATPESGTEITGSINNSDFSSDVLERTGSWTVSGTQIACAAMHATAGNQTFKVTASGSSDWQWNLDKIELIKVPDDYAMNNLVCGNTASSDEFNVNDVIIYPNPATETLNISNVEGFDTINIYDFSGRRLLSVDATENIDLSFIPSGVYMLHMVGGQNTYTETLIIKRN